MTTVLVMEVHRVAQSGTQVTDLFHPDCAVPTTDPTIRVAQPCSTPKRRRRETVLKPISRASLRSPANNFKLQQVVRSRNRLDGALEAGGRGNGNEARTVTARQPQQTESEDVEAIPRAPSQSSSSPSVLEKVTTRTSILRLLFWKRGKPDRTAPDLTTDSAIQDIAGAVMNDSNAFPISGTVGNGPPSASALCDSVLPDSTNQPGPVIASSTTGSYAPIIVQNPVQVSQQQLPVTSATHDSGIGLEIPVVCNSDADAVLESIDSTKLYSPAQDVFVGKQYELPPPERARHEWCYEVRPELIKNLRTVIDSLPPSFTRAETTVEPELCMSGRVLPGHQTVVLKPTVWIRCGSKACQKAVQRAVADLSHVKRFPINVTLHAPRPASASTVPFGLSWDLDVSRQDEADQILSVEHTEPTNGGSHDGVALILQDTLNVSVQPFAGARRSACGLKVEFSTPSGACYTSTLGGLILLNHAVMGLTTAHAVYGDASHVERTLDVRREDGNERNGDHSSDRGTEFEADESEAPLPASLFAAKFGNQCFPPVEATLGALARSNDYNADFVLLKLHPEHSQYARNAYVSSRGDEIIDRTSQDLTARVVHLVCSSESPTSGHLLDGDCTILDKEGHWITRKIQLEKPLPAGSSGTWVVDGRALLGVIIAVYESACYAHMVPIASIFSAIESLSIGGSENMKVEVRGRILVERKQEISSSMKNVPNSMAPAIKTRRGTENNEDIRSVPRKFLIATFPMLLMIFLVGLDSSAFPVVQPRVADLYGTIKLMGWLGSTYFLAFGMTYPVIGRLFILSPNIGVMFLLRLTFIVVFAIGTLCSYSVLSVQGIAVGRALCGLGAAGLVPDPGTIREVRGISFLVYSIGTFIGPIIAGAMLNNIPADVAVRLYFLMLLSATLIVFLITLIHNYCLFRKSLGMLSRPMALNNGHHNPARSKFVRILLHLDIPGFLWGSSAVVCVQLGWYYGSTIGWTTPSAITLLIVSVFCFGVFMVTQGRKSSFDSELPAMIPFNVLGLQSSVEASLVASWGFAFYPLRHIITLWLQTSRNQSSLRTSILYMPISATHLFTCLFVMLRFERHERRVKVKDEEKEALIDDVRSGRGHVVSAIILIISSGCMSLAAGLLLTIDADTSLAEVLGLQVVLSVGAGLGASQIGFFGTRWSTASTFHGDMTALERMHAIPKLTVFAESIGASMGITIAQSRLIDYLSKDIPKHGSTTSLIWDSGPISFREKLSGDVLSKALDTWNGAVTNMFFLPAIAGAFSLFVYLLSLGLVFKIPVIKWFSSWRMAGWRWNPISLRPPVPSSQQS